MVLLELREGRGPIEADLSDDEGEALSRSDFVRADRLRGGRWRLKLKGGSRPKVGVATVGETTVFIYPKIPIRRILFMLGYARNPGWQDDLVSLAEVSDLVTAMARLFADQAERALAQGPLRDYVGTDASSTVLRGRLRDREQLQRRYSIGVPLEIHHDDYTVDVPENQLLLAAADVLVQMPGVAGRTGARLQGLRQVLAEVTPHLPGTPLPTWSPTRLNRGYHVVLQLAEVVLRGNAVDQASGDVKVGGFLVDMANLYEDFLTVALTEAFREHGGRCRSQDRRYLDIANRIEIKPDLVWYVDGRPIAVVDAKYKAEKKPRQGLPTTDLYQMLAYCAARGVKDGHLVYAEGKSTKLVHEVREAGITIHIHALDLDTAPKDLLAQIAALASDIASRFPVHT